MSLISQNVRSERGRRKHRAEEVAEVQKSLRVEGEEEAGVAGSPSSHNPKRKKKSRTRDTPGWKEKEDAELEREEEERLEKALFGSLYSRPEFGGEEDGGTREVSGGPSASQIYLDRAGHDGMVVYEEDSGTQPGGVVELVEEGRKPVWFDDEEEKMRVDVTKVNRLRKLRETADESIISGGDYVSRLRAQHVKLNPGTDWARIGPSPYRDVSSDDESGDESGITVAHGYEDAGGDDVLRSNGELVVKSRGTRLLPGVLEYSKLTDANVEESSSAPINSVQFHRNAQLLLAAGLDRRLRFFQVDGKRNTRVESIFIEDCPVRKASFLPDGSQVIIGGRRKFFYCFDLIKAKVDKVGPLTGRDERSLEVFEVSPDSSTIAFIGNEGYILLVSSKTKELIGTLKMNGTARSLAFAHNGRQLLSSGGDGHIYHWDVRTMKCFHKAVDEGCLTGSALCTSPDGSFFAAGSSSGIVNIYKHEEFLAGKRKPAKTIENLTTSVDFVKFNHDSQILAINSSMKKNSLKLVHLPSFTVYSNWPVARSSLQYPRCVDFSPNGGFMAVGNAAGKVLLYKLHHYQNA